MLSAAEARARVQARLDRNVEAERDQLLEKIDYVISSADCLVVSYLVPIEHASFVGSYLATEGYKVYSGDGVNPSETNLIISFEE